MKKYTWLCVVICLLGLMVAGCTTEAVDQPTEQTAATTEETLSGLADSIFDDPTLEVYQPSVKVDQETTPVEETTGTETPTTTEAATTPTGTDDQPLTYEQWLKLTPTEQRLYQESFSDIEAFYVWYDAAKQAYEEANPPIEIGSGSVDMSTLPT